MKKLIKALVALVIVIVVVGGGGFLALTVWSPQNLARCSDSSIYYFRLEVAEVGVIPQGEWVSHLSPFVKTNVYGGILLAFDIWRGKVDACALTPIRTDNFVE